MPSKINSSPARAVAKGATQQPQPITQRKKTRVVRRRGRAKDDIESDDEIERAVATDSDMDEDNNDLSSPESDSDSDTEPASEDVIANGISRAITSSTSQSPQDGLPIDKKATQPPFFPPGGNWSEMVTDENTNGPADLPVIDFAELGNHPITPSSGTRHRKPKKFGQKVEPSQSAHLASHTLIKAESETQESTPSVSQHSPGPSFPRRLPGQTARQAYQHRLESDPSYVPTVGGFWGHDDRLLDKELRSLSGWWRGRWQGRGRGRGFPMRGRGRGGFIGSDIPQNSGVSITQDEETLTEASLDVPPIERTWTHDGFEEMKKKEEYRRVIQQPTNPGPSGFRGVRGGPVARARGAYGRGSFLSSPTRSRFAPSLHHPGRVWYAMKPELMWTKQHEGYLYLDPSLKPRAGQGPGFRIKLPGLTPPEVIRTHPARVFKPSSTKEPPPVPAEETDKRYHVHLPKRAGKEKAESSLSTDNTPIEDVFTVRPRLVTANPIPLPTTAPLPASDLVTKTATTPSSATTNISPSPPAESSSSTPLSSLPDPSVRSQLELLTILPQISDPARRAQTEEAVLRNPPNIEERASEEFSESSAGPRPPLPPLQTTFPPPVPQMSPAFGSPYGFPTLPLGVGVNQHGMAYELATGRPVYLHHPTPVYNPRPMMHSHVPPPGIPFVPGHLQQHSTASPDFLAPHTPPAMNGFIDPATGASIFSFPRQTSRIEIRAPTTESSAAKPLTKPNHHRPSGLRGAATSFEPTRNYGYFPTPDGQHYALDPSGPGDDIVTQHQVVDPALFSYPTYQQPYYYPDAYVYPQYMDISQAGQFDAYSPDPRATQGTVYY